MDDVIYGFSDATATELLRKMSLPGPDDIPDLHDNYTTLTLAYTTAGATARSGTTLGTGTATLYYLAAVSLNRVLTTQSIDITFYNFSTTAVDASTYIELLRLGDVFIYVGSDDSSASIQYQIISTSTASSGPYTGLKIASVTIRGAPCNRSSLIGTVVDVVDHSACIFDLTSAQLLNAWGWASERIFLSLAAGAPVGTLTPCHWSADDRCCVGGV